MRERYCSSHVAASAVLSNASNTTSGSGDSPAPNSPAVATGASAASAASASNPYSSYPAPPCTPGTGIPGRGLTSNGLSFDSDRFEFREFVDVASQASLDREASDRAREDLQDAVTAYEMQNKFLNKEVLELNQLRQQAIDREQKLFM